MSRHTSPHTHHAHTHAGLCTSNCQKVLKNSPVSANSSIPKAGRDTGEISENPVRLRKEGFLQSFFFSPCFLLQASISLLSINLSSSTTCYLTDWRAWASLQHFNSELKYQSNSSQERNETLCYKLIPSSFSPLSQMLRAKQSRLPSQRYPGKSSASLWSHFFPVISHVFHLSLGIKSCLGSARSLPPLCARGGRRAGFGNRPSHPLLPGFAPASSQYQSHHQLDHSVQFVPSRLRSAPRLETRISWFLCKEKVTPTIILTVLFVKDIAWKAVFQCTSKPEKPMSVCGVYVKVLDRTILLLMSSWK